MLIVACWQHRSKSSQVSKKFNHSLNSRFFKKELSTPFKMTKQSYGLVFLLVFCSLQSSTVQAQVDLTLVERANGSDVTEATTLKIRKAQIFSDDYDFLLRLAYVESEFGLATDNPNDGGIWQVNTFYLLQSKSTKLQSYHDQIDSVFGIQWQNVTYRDLLKPLYSGLAARLYLASIPDPIPQKLEEQSTYWLLNYNQRDYTKQVFVIKIREMEEKQRNCTGKMDAEIVLDGSGSVGTANFDKARQFTVSLVESFSLNNTRVGFIVYSTSVTNVFPLENQLTLEQMKAAINGFRYVGGNTNTNEAIRQAVATMQAASARPGIPRVLTILTDGQSTSGIGNIELARQANIATFGVGIGTGINQAELLKLALDDPSHVFALTDFDALKEFFKRLNEETCQLPQKPAFNSTTADELEGRQRRFYEYNIGSDGLTVQIGTLLGQVVGYYSTSVENPSSALNDGILGSSTFIDNPKAASKLYLTIEGVDSYSLYTITVYQGKV